MLISLQPEVEIMCEENEIFGERNGNDQKEKKKKEILGQ